LQIDDGRVRRLPFLEKLSAITGKKSMELLELNECSADAEWNSPKLEITNIAIEEKGKFRIEGTLSVREKSLSGAIQLGLASEYLEWLPNPAEVFPTDRASYRWTTVHLSGTIDQPGQDLSPRIIDALKESPSAFLSLIFRQVGEWLKDAFGNEL
jgi:hypothetical protein